MARNDVLAKQELEVMKIVWELGSATVRDVHERLLEKRKLAYTTVMTTMKILEEKKYLKRSGGERAFVYQPAKPKSQVVRGMVAEFVDRVFNGATRPLLLQLVKDRRLSEEDLEEIRRMLKEQS
jgi:BlaI family transcriptional regulator, penicillinase repressor